MPTNFPGSLDSFVNPTATDRLNGDPNPAVLHHVQHSNLNDAMSAVETKLGINFSANATTIDFALNALETMWMTHPQGAYKEVTYISTMFPSIITWYTDATKTIKLLQKQYTYGPGNKKFITQVVRILYDGTIANTTKKTITDTITLSGPKETSRTRTIV